MVSLLERGDRFSDAQPSDRLPRQRLHEGSAAMWRSAHDRRRRV